MKIKNFIGNILNIFFESKATEIFFIPMLFTRDSSSYPRYILNKTYHG